MTGKDLISVIQSCNMEECEITVKSGYKDYTIEGIELGVDKIVIYAREE